MFSWLIIIPVLHGQLTIVKSDCDTTDIYTIRHDYLYYKINLVKQLQSDPCRKHGFCPTVDGNPIVFRCGYGFYNYKTDSTSSNDCLPCPAGKYCAGNVLDCEPGYYCPADGLPKEPWPGYYAPNAGMTEPVECPAGTYQNHIQHIKWNWRAISRCQYCPRHMFCDATRLTQPAGNCDDGWYCEQSETSARPAEKYCQAGEYCIAGKKMVCMEGTYQSAESMYECFECPEGKFCAGTGLIAPSGDCDSGWYCDKRETTLQPTGKRCPAGYMCPNGKLTPCGKGYYQPNAGQTTCIVCPVGKYCDSIGLANPTGNCDPGCCLQVAQIAKSACPLSSPTSCDQRFYDANGVCLPCPEGMYCGISGLSAPSGPCEPGWYCDLGEITPTPVGKLCPAGYECPAGVKVACSSQVRDEEPFLGHTQYFYQPDRGQTKCIECPERYNCSGTALSNKGTLCSPGYRCHFGLHLECDIGHFCYGGKMLPCWDGFTTYERGQDTCVRCEEGSLCENGKILPCPENMVCFNGLAEYCELGYECSVVNGKNIKTACAPGTERYEVSSAKCVQCREKWYCRSASSYECLRYNEGFYCEEGVEKPFLRMAGPGQYYYFTADSYDTNRGYLIGDCPVGKYQDESFKNDCCFCKAGQFCDTVALSAPAGPCSAGYYCYKGSTSPTEVNCPAGHYCEAASPSPSPCAAGTFQPHATKSACLPCTSGYFCDRKKLLDPVDICPVGKKCPEGTSFPVPCLNYTKEKCVCDAGYYCDNVDENPRICPIGHSCVKGSSIPSACLSGFYQSNPGQESCKVCPAGFYCDQAEAQREKQSGIDRETHGVVTPKKCPKFVYCGPGTAAADCQYDLYASGELDILISCKPGCRPKMTPFGDLKFKAACSNCGNMVSSYQWSMKKCISANIEECAHCKSQVTYLPEYKGNTMAYNRVDNSQNHTDWKIFAVVIKITLQNGTEGMAHFIWEYLEFSEVQCQILPVSGVALVTDFSISCSDPELPYDMTYTCNMYYDYTTGGDTIIYKTNATCNQAGVMLRQGDKNKGYRQHLKVVGRNLDHILWEFQLVLLVELPPMTKESVGSYIDTVIGAIKNASDDKELVGALYKLQGLTYVLNEAKNEVNETEPGNNGTKGENNGEKRVNDTDTQEEKRKENTKIRDTIVSTLSKVNTTTVEVIATVASTLNQVTLKKDELSPETKEKTFELYNTYTKQFQQIESTEMDEQVTNAAKALVFGVSSLIDIVTDEIELEDSSEETDDGEDQATTDSPPKATTPSVISKEEKERAKQQVKDRTEKLIKTVDDIADIVITRQDVDMEPTTVQTTIMSISIAKVSPANLVGKPIKTEISGDDTATSLTLPDDLPLSDKVGSIGTEFIYLKKNPYVWADNSKNIEPPIVSIKLKDSDNRILNISNTSSPVEVNLASDDGGLVGEIPILLRFVKNNKTITLAPSQRRPCAATFEFTVQRDRAVAFSLSLPEHFTSVRLSVGVETRFDVVHTMGTGFRYPEDTNIIRGFYGKLSERDEVQFDNTAAYCQTCSENCCNTTGDCRGIYKHCIYYCNTIIQHPLTAGCSEIASPAVYCHTCMNQCCNVLKNCTGYLENCVIFCNMYIEKKLTTECLAYVDTVTEKYTALTENVTVYCENCREMCCVESETCTGIHSNCLYFCEYMMLENITASCNNQTVTSSVETMYLFPRSYITEIEKSHQIYFGLSIDPTDARVIQDIINMEPLCLGNVSVEACLVDVNVTIPFKLSSMQCEYWDESNQRWSSKGLEISKDSGDDTLQCLSSHLTSFSKTVFVAPHFINPTDVKLFLTFFENPVVVTVVIVVWMIYFFLVHWAKQKDKSDTEQVGVNYCADNVATHTYTYLVCIVTGWWTKAGTTANVYIYLKGTEETSPRKCLKTPVRKCFQTGSEDWFLLTTEHSLGDIRSVTLWHDNTGSSPHWYVNQVFVKDMQKNSSWTFIYNDWLAVDRGSLQLTTTTLLPVTEEEMMFKKKYNFVIKSTQDLRDGHIWLSVFSKPANSTFTRVQRLTCCLTLLLTTMLTNIMFYGIPTDDPNDQVGTGGFKLSLSQIVIGIESSLIMFPVNMLIVQLFLKVKTKPPEQDSEPKPIEYFLEVFFGSKWQAIVQEINRILLELTNVKDEEEIKVFTRVTRPSKDLILDSISNEMSKKNDGKVLPWWFVYVAWVIAMLTCIVASYFVMLYGLKYGYTRSAEWMVSFFTGFFQSIFVQQPIKVFGLAIVLTLIFNQTAKFDDRAPDKRRGKGLLPYTVHIERRDKDEEYLHSVCITPPETHQLVMEPLPKRLLDMIRRRLRIEWLMDVTLRDIVFHALYLTVILIMVHGHRSINQAFRNTETVRSIFVEPSHGFHLLEVSRREDFYTYLQETVVPAMADITADHEFASLGSNHFLVGTYRLRQLRMKREDCKPIMDNLPQDCKDSYWMGGEDTKSYNQSWLDPLPAQSAALNPDHWVHRSAWELQTLPYPGAHATYAGGGYVVNLPVDVTKHPDIFSNLVSIEWIDGYTRAVFLEFTLFNPNVDLFTVAVYLFEFSTTGRIFPMHNEFTSSLYHYSSDNEVLIACCEALVFCFNILFVSVEIKKLRQNGKLQYFSDLWSYIEIIQICLAITLFGLIIKRIHSANSVIQEFKNSKGQVFVNFYSAIFWDFVFGYISATLIGLVIMKSVKHMRFNQRTKIVSKTLGLVKSVILGYLIMFAITTVAFAHVSYLMFGRGMQDFQTFGDSWVAIIIVLMGEGDYLGLQNSYHFLGPLFVVAVIMSCQYGLLVMMTTILNVGRLEARFHLSQKKNKFELLNYIGSKIKLVLNIK